MSNRIISLNVGGGSFTVLMSSLEKSQYFAKLLCGGEDLEGTYYGEDGNLFLDRDSDMFAHILQWLRKGKINVKDEETLMNLRDEAEFFELGELAAEINKKLDTVQRDDIHYRLLDPEELKNLSELNSTKQTTPGIDNNCRVITSVNYVEKVWKCRRGIYIHQNPKDCGRKCHAYLSCNHTDWVYEERVRYLVAVSNT